MASASHGFVNGEKPFSQVRASLIDIAIASRGSINEEKPFSQVKTSLIDIATASRDFINEDKQCMSLISKYALNQGMSQHVLVVYRHAVATLVIAPFALVYDRPTIDQNLFYSGMKYTSATFTSAMCNVLPAFAFTFAWIFK
ncbi:hypothetical protein Gohar_020292 [Gossypium harknessii]|uniref:Uncharacterized protein n=1 Tax=Gossypium harknessii TaxID=34285 RepID=A0A7J9HX72_9ROSI|nr:hypothetical protein [Gossypium harknessii]